MAAQKTASMTLRYFNVKGWALYFLAFLNYGRKGRSANRDIRQFVGEIQRYVQSFCMLPESSVPRAPEKATVVALIKLIQRANTFIAARLLDDNVERKVLDHNDPAYEPFFIYPAPLYTIQNSKIRGWAELALQIAQACVHHADNEFQSGFTEKFKNDIWPHFKQMQTEIAVDLLGMNRATVEADGFLLDPATIVYDPAAYDVPLEQWHTRSGVPRLSADGWEYMTKGIPTDLIPECPEFPALALITAAGGTGNGLGIPDAPTPAEDGLARYFPDGANGSQTSSAGHNLDSKT
jgi:hypothetical protein